MSQNQKRASVYKKQARQIIFYVYNFMKAEAEAKNEKVGIRSLEKKTAEATKSSWPTVRRIRKEATGSNGSAVELVTPGKRRPKTNALTNFSPLEKGQIKRLIHTYHVTENEMLTSAQLTKKLADTVNYKGSSTGLRKTLKELGFRFKKVESGNKQLLLEKSEIRLQRIGYLQTLRNYRQAGREIVYTHHAFLEVVHWTGHLRSKKAVDSAWVGVFTASTDCYIPGVTYVFVSKKEDYDEIFYVNYDKWIKEHLLPNLPDNSVVIISAAKYHYKEFEVTPTPYSNRSDMTDWLMAKNIKFELDWLKPQLYSLIKAYKAKNKQFLIDKLLSERNHTILRLPVCHPDLNPLEIAWKGIGDHVRNKGIKITMDNINNAIRERIGTMGDEFKEICRKVKDIEQEYRKSDYIIDLLTDEFKVYGGESSDGDDDDDVANQEESDEDMESDEDSESDVEIVIKEECIESDE